MNDQSIIQIDQILLTFPIVDTAKIETMISYDPTLDLIKELIEIFNVEMKDKLVLIKKECENKSYEELGKLSHRIRSTSLNLGTMRLAEIFKRLEYLSAEANPPLSELRLLIQAAEKEYVLAAEKLNTCLGKFHVE